MNPEEIRRLLAELDERLGAELAGFWHSIAGEVSSDEFRDLMVSAYPEIVTPYIAAAADLGATVYDLAPSDNPDFKARPAELAPVEKLQASASWALNTGAGEAALALLQGSATRSMFDGYRDTIVENAAAEPGAKWVRHASANACGFCRMQATRGAVYHSEQSAGGSHDGCHCIAVMVRPGQDYTPPPYVEEWKDDYAAARQDGLTDPKDIAKAMDNAPTGKATLARNAREAAKKDKAKVRSASAIGPPQGPVGIGRTGAGDPEPDPEWMRESLAHANGLTDRYRQHMIDYTGKGHEVINGWLRGSSVSKKSEDYARSRVKSIDAVLAKYPLKQTEQLHRVVDMKALGISRGEDLSKLAGSFRIEKGYLSTSRKAKFDMKEMDKPVHLDVIAPEGTPAAAIEDISAVRDQYEVLLGRNCEYMIVNPRYDDELGAWRATMQIL
ncbi:ADP-ribosyltransferase [Gordonia malaquae]|uniref:VG15 protein n=1 Tax=Gordonia malaquae TaxID=410332 RepID=UPI00301B3F2F